MATLETIRKRAGILMMGAIGLAMLGFILGDFNLRPSTKIAEIDDNTNLAGEIACAGGACEIKYI